MDRAIGDIRMLQRKPPHLYGDQGLHASVQPWLFGQKVNAMNVDEVASPCLERQQEMRDLY